MAVRKDSGNAPLAASATDAWWPCASTLADTMPMTLPHSSTSTPPELPGCDDEKMKNEEG
ncbi:MAG TPA: hypothetical protein VGH42_13905 [Verrucomicrobiae bacterium]